jgi:flagellar protein FlgJ
MPDAGPPPAGAPSGGGAASSTQMTYFARRLGPLLQEAAQRLGVSARVLLAQAALETGWGRAVVGNNVFGIKAGSTWSGARVTAATHEVENGRSVPATAEFRSYGSLGEAVQDFVSLVADSGRYRSALGAGNNAKNYGEALIKSGYATDTDYPAKLAAVAASPAIEAAFVGPIPLVPPDFAGRGTATS